MDEQGRADLREAILRRCETAIDVHLADDIADHVTDVALLWLQSNAGREEFIGDRPELWAQIERQATRIGRLEGRLVDALKRATYWEQRFNRLRKEE